MTELEKEETIGEANNEPINFRVPKNLKERLKLMAEYEMVASVGELLRGIARKHIQEVENTRGFKVWTERREAEEAAKKE